MDIVLVKIAAAWAIDGWLVWGVIGVLLSLSPLLRPWSRRREIRAQWSMTCPPGLVMKQGTIEAEGSGHSFLSNRQIALSQKTVGRRVDLRFAPKLRIKTDEGAVVLGGPYHVISGNMESQRDGYVVHDIDLGAQVRVFGTMERSRDPSGYRDEFVLQGSSDSPLLVVALEGAVKDPRARVRSMMAAAAFVIATPLLGEVGVAADVAALAAVSPTTRMDVLGSVAEELRLSLTRDTAPQYAAVMSALGRRCHSRSALQRVHADATLASLTDCPEQAPRNDSILEALEETTTEVRRHMPVIPPTVGFAFSRFHTEPIFDVIVGEDPRPPIDAEICHGGSECRIARALHGLPVEDPYFGLDLESEFVMALALARAHCLGEAAPCDEVTLPEYFESMERGSNTRMLLRRLPFVAPGLQQQVLQGLSELSELGERRRKMFSGLARIAAEFEIGMGDDERGEELRSLARTMSGEADRAVDTTDARQELLALAMGLDPETKRVALRTLIDSMSRRDFRSALDDVTSGAEERATMESALGLGEPSVDHINELGPEAAEALARWRPDLAAAACLELQDPTVYDERRPFHMVQRVVRILRLRGIYCGSQDTALLERLRETILDSNNIDRFARLEVVD